MADQERTAELLPVREAEWSEARGRRVLGAVRERVQARARTGRRAGVGLAVCAAAAIALAVWRGPSHEGVNEPPVAQVAATPAALPEARTLRFADGSSVELLDGAAEVEVMRVEPERVEVGLARGSARFHVVEQPSRSFVVRVASLALEVIGTEFVVTREAERVHVAVERGRVAVTGSEGRRELSAQEAAWFALRTEPVEDAQRAEEIAPPAASAAHETPTRRPHHREGHAEARERFLSQARGRKYAEAMAVLRAEPSVVRDTAEELMLAADAARLSGDPAAAVPFLERVTRDHASDTRAPLAAFTLGRILLVELGRAAEAQAAFALTRRLSAQGALAEDALAREVEAAERAGQRDAARSLASEYLARYPTGRRRDQVARVLSTSP